MLASNIIAIFHSNIQIIYLEAFFPNEATVGRFAVLILLNSTYWTLCQGVFNITNPLINVKGSKYSLKKLYFSNYLIILCCSAILTATLLVFANNILAWFGSEFTSISVWIYIIAITNIVAIPFAASYSILEYSHYQKQLLILNAVVFAFVLISMPLFVTWWGSIGAVISLACTNLIVNVPSAIYMRIKLKIKPLLIV